MHNYDGATYRNADIQFLSLLFLDPEILQEFMPSLNKSVQCNFG